MARVRQTARKRAVGAGKSRAKAAAVNAGAEAESETESESESWLDKVDGFGQADAESEAPSPAAFCAPGAEPAAKLWSFSTVDNNLGEDSECEPEEYDKKVLQFEQAQRKRKEANAQKWSRMAGLDVIHKWCHQLDDRTTANASDGCGLSTPPAAPHSAPAYQVPVLELQGDIADMEAREEEAEHKQQQGKEEDDDAERSRLVCFLCQQSGICQKGCAANGSCHASSQPLRWQKDRNDMYDTTSAMYSQLHHGVKYIHSSIVSGAYLGQPDAFRRACKELTLQLTRV